MTSPRLYHISQDGEMLGEFTEEQARHYLEEGSLHPDDIAWAPGLENWQTLQLLFLTPVEAPPPLPQTAPTSSASAAATSPATTTGPASKGPLTPSRPSVPTIASIYTSTPPPLPHQRPHRTIIAAQSPASPARQPAPPPVPQRFQTNLPTPALTPPSSPPAPLPATWLPPTDPHFVPVHLRKRRSVIKPLIITFLIIALTVIAILLTAHFTGHQQKLLHYLPALEPVFQWLTQNVPTALPEDLQIRLTE